MLALRRIDHVCLRVADLEEAVPRWCIQFGLTETTREDGRAYLRCGYEPYSLELVADDILYGRPRNANHRSAGRRRRLAPRERGSPRARFRRQGVRPPAPPRARVRRLGRT